MASKVKKGFLYYIAWLAFIVVGVACIFACVLIFNPGKDVFGINLRWVSDTRYVEYQKINDTWFKDANITTVEFNSTYTNFSVVKNDTYAITTLGLNKHIVGFSDSDTYTYSTDIKLDGTTLKITVTEPKLSLPLGPNATMTLFCPMDLDLNNISFKVNTTSGGIGFGAQGSNTIVNVKDVDIVTENGGINIASNAKIASGNLDITCKNSTTYIYTNLANQLNIETESSNVYIEKISGNLNISATELKVDAKKILGNVQFCSQKGYMKIDELGDLTNKTNGNFTAEVDQMHIANIVIGKMAGNLTLPSSEASSINVGELYGEALIETSSGDVKIENAYKDLSITSNTGSVTFTQNSDTSYCDIKTAKGKIVATFNAVKTAELESENGNIEINAKDGLKFNLDYNAGKNINVSWITTQLNKVGVITSAAVDQGQTTTNTITAKTLQSITVKNFQ